MVSKLIYCNIILLFILIHIIIQFIIDRMDYVILMYLIFNKTELLSKYRDYFPIFHNIPYIFDKIIFMIVYIFYIPIVILFSTYNYLTSTNIIYGKNSSDGKNTLMNDIYFNLKHPLMFSKGMVYNGILPYFYCMKLNIIFGDNTFNKLSWNTFFCDNNIPTPKILAYVNDGIIDNIDKSSGFNYGCSTIIKPVNGSCGNDISIFDKNNIPVLGKYIIQEKIDCLNNIVKSYRIITNCTNQNIEIWGIYMLISNNIVSNVSQGGEMYKHISNSNKFISKKGEKILLSNEEYKLFKYAIKDAIIGHQELIFCPTIGWDVIINKDKYFFLEGNIGVPTITGFDEDYKKNEYINFIKNIYNRIIR